MRDKEEIIKKQDAKFKQLSKYLGNKKFLIGNNVTIADFELYDAIKWHDEFDDKLISKYGNLKEYIARFENLAKVKSFLNSPNYMKNFFVSIAQWGGNRK